MPSRGAGNVPPGAGGGQGIAPASAPQPPPRRDADKPRGLAAAPRGCCCRLARSVAAGSRKSCPSPVLWNGSWAAGSASKNVEQCRGQPKSHFLLAPRTFPGDSSLAEAGKFAASALDKIQTVAAKTVPSPGRGGGGLQQSGGACGRAGVPVARGGCKLEKLQTLQDGGSGAGLGVHGHSVSLWMGSLIWKRICGFLASFVHR
ncbi:uncharacterized protein LOC115341132 isoform X2 [Aquila chrysaetos chrysaetos]|uniref:uncharacterized protein LOC115341132 isoform X2 n=1 Tax=Aquila chrysaetos chrysaetos TaxID=223781 RepID=UPI00117727EE|nr:uncharacterized protein LOC115341132 isoform X2 [Aquila chrysaetos chrysaetos]